MTRRWSESEIAVGEKQLERKDSTLHMLNVRQIAVLLKPKLNIRSNLFRPLIIQSFS